MLGTSGLVPQGLARSVGQPSVQGVGVLADPEQEPRQCLSIRRACSTMLVGVRPTWINSDVHARSAKPGVIWFTLVASVAMLRGCATKSQPLPMIVAPRPWTLVLLIVRMPHSMTMPNSLQQKADERWIWMRSRSAPRTQRSFAGIARKNDIQLPFAREEGKHPIQM